MNTPNNKRRRESRDRLETAFVRLLQNRELNQITVTKLCEEAGVNRTTFYANYFDIYDLADAVQKRLEGEVFSLYQKERDSGYNSNNFLKIFRHVRENQLFYKTYFKLGMDGTYQITEYDTRQAMKYYDNRHIEYHMEFFKNGLNAILKKWLENDCRESPEEMFDIIMEEYRGKMGRPGEERAGDGEHLDQDAESRSGEIC